MHQILNVVVTGVGGRSVGHQILQALQLCPSKYNIITTDADSFSYGLYQVEKRYLVPPAKHPEYLTSILNVINKESANLLFPGTEAEVLILSKYRKKIEDKGCLLITNPYKVIEICSNKWRLFEWLKQNGFYTPMTVHYAEWKDLVGACGFPIVAKPTENTGASRNVTLLNTEKEILQYKESMEESEIIFQEYVGDANNEYTVGVLTDRKSNIIDSIVINRKLTGLSLGFSRVIDHKTYSLSTGYSQGFIIKHEVIQKECEKLTRVLGMRGPANIQCRLDGNRVVIFEVHPRFSGTTSIRALAGFNEPDICARNFYLKEEFNRIPYQHDVAAIRAFNNCLVPLSTLNTVEKA